MVTTGNKIKASERFILYKHIKNKDIISILYIISLYKVLDNIKL